MYYCFLCNRYHICNFTEEHFIPRSIDGPRKQWLPVCVKTNRKSNDLIDKKIRDIFYWERFSQTGAVKRNGVALLRDGNQVPYKFSYMENNVSEKASVFNYFINSINNTKIPQKDVYAIVFPVGLLIHEQEVYCKAIIKMTIGALVYCLLSRGIKKSVIRKICSNQKMMNLRRYTLNLKPQEALFKKEIELGQTNILESLQKRCQNPSVRNHAINIVFKTNSLVAEGMLYSKYGWKINIECNFCPQLEDIFLENPLKLTLSTSDLVDKTLSPDRIIIINPDYVGTKPEIPDVWKNK